MSSKVIDDLEMIRRWLVMRVMTMTCIHEIIAESMLLLSLQNHYCQIIVSSLWYHRSQITHDWILLKSSLYHRCQIITKSLLPSHCVFIVNSSLPIQRWFDSVKIICISLLNQWWQFIGKSSLQRSSLIHHKSLPNHHFKHHCLFIKNHY